MSNQNNILDNTIKLNDEIYVIGSELIAGSTFLLVHKHKPYNLCLKVPGSSLIRLHWIERALKFNAYNILESDHERDEAKQKVLNSLCDDDIFRVNQIFDSAISSDYADYIEGEDYFNFKIDYSNREVVVEKLEGLKIHNPTLRD